MVKTKICLKINSWPLFPSLLNLFWLWYTQFIWYMPFRRCHHCLSTRVPRIQALEFKFIIQNTSLQTTSVAVVCMCVFLCSQVCVCVREVVRKRERKRLYSPRWFQTCDPLCPYLEYLDKRRGPPCSTFNSLFKNLFYVNMWVPSCIYKQNEHVSGARGSKKRTLYSLK